MKRAADFHLRDKQSQTVTLPYHRRTVFRISSSPPTVPHTLTPQVVTPTLSAKTRHMTAWTESLCALYRYLSELTNIIRASCDGMRAGSPTNNSLPENPGHDYQKIQAKTGIRQVCLLCAFLSPLVIYCIEKTSTEQRRNGVERQCEKSWMTTTLLMIFSCYPMITGRFRMRP